MHVIHAIRNFTMKPKNNQSTASSSSSAKKVPAGKTVISSQATPAKKVAPAKKAAPVKKAASVTKAAPAKKAAPVTKTAPAKKAAPANKVAPAKKAVVVTDKLVSRKNLTRFTYETAAFEGWRLCLGRAGSTFTKYFPDKKFGGGKESLAAAEHTLAELSALIESAKRVNGKLTATTIKKSQKILQQGF